MSGKTSRYREEDDPSTRDDAMDDLGTSRRQVISTVDPGRDRRGARDLARLEREQRVNEDRKTAIKSGWFNMPSDLPPGEQLADIAGGQSHRARLEREQRERDAPEPTIKINGARKMTSGVDIMSRTGQGGSRPTASQPINVIQCTLGPPPSIVRPRQPSQAPKTQSYTTYQFKSHKTEANGSSDVPPNVPSGLDPALDATRQGYMGKIAPGRGPPPASASKNGTKSKSKPKKTHISRPPVTIPAKTTVSRDQPQVHPLFASGNLVVNPQPLPVEISSKSSIEAFLNDRWAQTHDESPDANPPSPVVALKVSTTLQQTGVSREADDFASVSAESSQDESINGASSKVDLEDCYKGLLALEPGKYNAQQFNNDMDADDTPTTTPEPSTPATSGVVHPSNIRSPVNLINDEPARAEFESLPEAIPALSEKQVQAMIVPVGSGNTEEHRRALEDPEAFETWLKKTRGLATHKPATNTSQFISSGFKDRGLMGSKYAS